jgi:phosphohistidine phosphatase SixA
MDFCESEKTNIGNDMKNNRIRAARLFLIVACCCIAPSSGAADEDLWSLVSGQSDMVIVMRHTEAGGGRGAIYDASGACAGEAMLTPRGREQAEAIGVLFRKQGLTPRVVASAMCRTRDTAMLAFGKAELDPALRESATGDSARFQEFLAAASGWIRKYRGTRPLVLVTHLPNIDSLTGEQPGHGEAIIARADESGELDVLGRVVLYRLQ